MFSILELFRVLSLLIGLINGLADAQTSYANIDQRSLTEPSCTACTSETLFCGLDGTMAVCMKDTHQHSVCVPHGTDCTTVSYCTATADCSANEACVVMSCAGDTNSRCFPTCGPASSASSTPSAAPTVESSTVFSSPAPTAAVTISTPEPTAAATVTTPEPTIAPTVTTPAPTAGVAEHLVIHLYDTHGDGWRDALYLRVEHENGDVQLHSLHCGCKVVRIFSGDVTVSLWRNRTIPGPKGDVIPYEWEALWTIGYSDGITETSFDIYGDVDTEVSLEDYEIIHVRDAVNVDEKKPNNMCLPPKPKPQSSSAIENATDARPSPTVDVRLALFTSDGGSWCDDSGDSSSFTCSKEHHLSSDATLPNLLTYPRYVISRADDNRVVASGTMREAASERVTSVPLLREGSFVFSVSGSYPGEASVSWDFCGEQGGINERLHFNMVKSVCHAHNIEEVDGELSCAGELTNDIVLNNPIHALKASNNLHSLRSMMSSLIFVCAAGVAVALSVLLVALRRKKNKREFARLDITEHI